MTWEEFCGSTLAEIEALEERRAIGIRHERFNSALVVSVLVNRYRSEDMEPVSPFDFIAGFEKDPIVEAEEKKRKGIKQAIATMFSRMDKATPEQVQKRKTQVIADLTNEGVEDPEEIFRELFPDL